MEGLGALRQDVFWDIFETTDCANASVISRISVVANVSVVAVGPKIHRLVGRASIAQEPVFVDQFSKVSASHVDEYLLLFQIVANVLACWGVQLAVH
jgi:hypothetical protein